MFKIYVFVNKQNMKKAIIIHHIMWTKKQDKFKEISI